MNAGACHVASALNHQSPAIPSRQERQDQVHLRQAPLTRQARARARRRPARVGATSPTIGKARQPCGHRAGSPSWPTSASTSSPTPCRCRTSMTVLLPQRTTTQIGMTGATTDGPPPVLYLLHGLSDDDTIWLRRTSIERYVAPLGLAVVMPQVHRSFYTDEALRRPLLDVPVRGAARSWSARCSGVSQRREDTFVAGLSMGGYGALKWALRQPERFAAAASLSGAVDVDRPAHRAGAPGGPAAVRPRLRRRRARRRHRRRPALRCSTGPTPRPLPAALPVLRHRGHADRRQPGLRRRARAAAADR